MKLLYVVGARPNFMKVAPIMHVGAATDGVEQMLVHTGQHFDKKMSDVFFEELGLPVPDVHLGVSGGSHASQTARIMLDFEPVLLEHRPDWLIVVGDVNSTVACSLVASKLGVRIAHVEAGLRSGDMAMPEEVNRRVTDAISNLLLTPSRDGDENLKAEGADPTRIKCVGNVMIDSLIRMLPAAAERTALADRGLAEREYVLATLHRPSNVDDTSTLSELIEGLNVISESAPVLFPVHPRTRAKMQEADITPAPNVRLEEPLGYLDFMCLMKSARAVVTDSGGLQEETTYLGVPCLTVRKNTERPVTITHGTNQLVDPTRADLLVAWDSIATTETKEPPVIEFWDGHAADRIIAALLDA